MLKYVGVFRLTDNFVYVVIGSAKLFTVSAISNTVQIIIQAFNVYVMFCKFVHIDIHRNYCNKSLWY